MSVEAARFAAPRLLAGMAPAAIAKKGAVQKLAVIIAFQLSLLMRDSPCGVIAFIIAKIRRSKEDTFARFGFRL